MHPDQKLAKTHFANEWLKNAAAFISDFHLNVFIDTVKSMNSTNMPTDEEVENMLLLVEKGKQLLQAQQTTLEPYLGEMGVHKELVPPKRQEVEKKLEQLEWAVKRFAPIHAERQAKRAEAANPINESTLIRLLSRLLAEEEARLDASKLPRALSFSVASQSLSDRSTQTDDSPVNSEGGDSELSTSDSATLRPQGI